MLVEEDARPPQIVKLEALPRGLQHVEAQQGVGRDVLLVAGSEFHSSDRHGDPGDDHLGERAGRGLRVADPQLVEERAKHAHAFGFATAHEQLFGGPAAQVEGVAPRRLRRTQEHPARIRSTPRVRQGLPVTFEQGPPLVARRREVVEGLRVERRGALERQAMGRSFGRDLRVTAGRSRFARGREVQGEILRVAARLLQAHRQRAVEPPGIARRNRGGDGFPHAIVKGLHQVAAGRAGRADEPARGQHAHDVDVTAREPGGLEAEPVLDGTARDRHLLEEAACSSLEALDAAPDHLLEGARPRPIAVTGEEELLKEERVASRFARRFGELLFGEVVGELLGE